MGLQGIIDRFTEPTDYSEPAEGRPATFLDHLIKGFILIFPLIFFREMVFPGFTEQDVYFCVFSVLFTLIAIIVAWRSASGTGWSIPYTILGLSGWSMICLAVCVWQILQGDDMAYRTAYYAAGLMLVIAIRVTGLRGRRYLKLFTVPLCIIYGFLIYHSFTGAETVFGIEALIKAPAELIPFLLLGCAVSVILFITAGGIVWRILYILIYTVGVSLLVMYGDMLSWCLLGAGTLGVILFMLLLPAYSKGRSVIKLLIILSVMFIAGLMTIVVFIQPGNGEWWYPVQRYGVSGLYVLAAFAVSFFIMLRVDRAVLRDSDIPWVIMAAIYLIQAFFYPLSVISMPVWLVYLAGAIPTPVMAYVAAKDEAAVSSDTRSDANIRLYDSSDDELEFLDLDDIEYAPQADESATGDKRVSRATVIRARRRLKSDRMKEVTLHTGLAVTALAGLALMATVVVISIRGRGMSAEELNGSMADSGGVMTQADSDVEPDVDTAVASDDTGYTDEPGMAEEISDGIIDVASVADYDPNDLGVDISGIDLSALGIDMGEDTDVADVEDVGISNGVDGAVADETQHAAESVSNGDYTIYDPNATYKKSNDIVAPASGSTRLRSEPSIGEEGEVVHVLGPNERVVRDGIGDNGWSRVKYRGRTCYAVTEYLSVQGTYHGDPAELIVETENDASAEADDQGNGADANDQPPDSQDNAGSAQSQAQTATTAGAKGKGGPAGYSIQWSADNKTCTIWSAGVKQGTLTVSDGQAAQKINVYSDYYVGSGKNLHKYLSISVPAGENPLSLSADGGFMSALRNMGYSGVYFNKQVIDW
ncbi:MAG: hypothetical protein IJS12_08850 [Lachnospiraceae bacterium]|nr:hypothetical protein [Lachnospiraceae bacterium]